MIRRSWVSPFGLLIPGQHTRFDRPRSTKPVLTQLFHRLGKVKVSTQRSLQENGQRARDLDMSHFGLVSPSSLVNQEDISCDFKSKADRFAFSGSKLCSQARIDLLHLPLLCCTCLCSAAPAFAPAMLEERMPRQAPLRFRVLHLDQNGVGNQNSAVDYPENVRMAEADEVIERTGIGNNDHDWDYRLLAVSTRSSVAMSLSRSSTV
jgi:hypothetical protein